MDSLKSNNFLTELNLQGNIIKNEGAKLLSQIINPTNAIKKLDLSMNEINDEGIKYLTSTSESNKLFKVNYHCHSYEELTLTRIGDCHDFNNYDQ